MSIIVQRPPGVNVGVNNPGTTVYIQGNDTTDGSLRFTTDGNGNILAEERILGVWTPADIQFSYASHIIDGALGEIVFDQNGEPVFVG